MSVWGAESETGTAIYDTYLHPVYGVIGFVGELFLWGGAGGAAFHFARGLRAAPSGAACANAPRVTGTFAAYCAAFSAVETAVSRARGSEGLWCSGGAAVWGLRGMRRGGAPAAAGGALLGAAVPLALYVINHAGMVWQSRRADADSVLLQKRMMARGQPTPVAIAASRTAARTAQEPTSEILYGKHKKIELGKGII